MKRKVLLPSPGMLHRWRQKRVPWGLGCWLALAASGLCFTADAKVALSDNNSPAAEIVRLKHRDKELDLLHLRIDLAGVRCLNDQLHQFVPIEPAERELTIINLWSLHCAPCMEEFQRFHNIVQHVRGQGYPINFLFIADPPEDNPEAAVRTFWAAPPVTLPKIAPCLSTDRRLRDSLRFDGVPVTLFVDRDRVVRHAYIGSIEGRGIAPIIERLLDVLRNPAPSSRRRPTPVRKVARGA